jgi:hypothetical protein
MRHDPSMGRRREKPIRDKPTDEEMAARREWEAARREQMEVEAPEWAWLAAELEAAGVNTRDLGRFVNDTRFIRPSQFDVLAAMPVLLNALPRLTQAKVVGAAAGHLNHRAARPTAFPVLMDQFKKWAQLDPLAGHSIADALATASDPSHVDELLAVAADNRYGESRAGIVEALWRYRKDARVAPALRTLLRDPDVSWPAMSALRRTVGNEVALSDLRRLHDTTDDPVVRQDAAEQIKRTQRTLAKSANATPAPSR